MPPGFSVGRLARARIGPAEGSKTLRLELQDRPLGRALQPYRVHGVQPLAQLVGSWAAVGDDLSSCRSVNFPSTRSGRGSWSWEVEDDLDRGPDPPSIGRSVGSSCSALDGR